MNTFFCFNLKLHSFKLVLMLLFNDFATQFYIDLIILIGIYSVSFFPNVLFLYLFLYYFL